MLLVINLKTQPQPNRIPNSPNSVETVPSLRALRTTTAPPKAASFLIRHHRKLATASSAAFSPEILPTTSRASHLGGSGGGKGMRQAGVLWHLLAT
jgi:hypothetical protein